MSLFITLLKNFLKYFLFVFITYLIIYNVTITLETLYEGFLKCCVMALMLTPYSVLNYFSPLIAKSACYKKEVILKRNFEEAFKNSRNLLKTMSDIKLKESDSEKGLMILQSGSSTISMNIETVDQDTVKIKVVSTPLAYKSIDDFKNYIKDVDNIILTLKLNLEDEKEYLSSENEETKVSEEIKPYLLLHYRLIKIWMIFILTLIIYFFTFYYTLKFLPETSTITFFVIFILYLSHLFTTEIVNTSKHLVCPKCDNKLFDHDYDIRNYRFPTICKHCDTKLI